MSVVDLWDFETRNSFPQYYYITNRPGGFNRLNITANRRGRFHTIYNERNNLNNALYIKKAYYDNPENEAAIMEAFHRANSYNIRNNMTNAIPQYDPAYDSHIIMIEKKDEPGRYIKMDSFKEFDDYKKGVEKAKPKSVKYAFIENPDGEIFLGEAEQKEGGTVFKKSPIKKHILGRDRVIYYGKYNKHYIKLHGKYVAVSRLFSK
jgi:hypothetical protein